MASTKEEECCFKCCNRIMPSRCKGKDGKIDIEPLSSWIILISVVLINIFIMTPHMSFGIFYDSIQERYDVTKSAVGWTMFVYAASGSLLSPVISPFIMYYGCRPVSVISSVVLALGMSLSTIAPNLAWFIIFFGLIGGIGFGGFLLCTMSIVQQCFPHNRGLATGISTLGTTTGAIIAPMLVEFFIREYGFSGALLLHASLFVQLIVFAALLKSPKAFIQRGKVQTASPGAQDEEENLMSASTKQQSHTNTASQDIQILFKNMLNFSVVKKRSFILCIFHFFFFMVGQFGLMSHTVSAAVHRGISHTNAAYLFTIMGLCNLVVKIASTMILNFKKINPLLYTCAGSVMLAACGLLLAFSDSYNMFLVGMVLMGGYQGTTVTVLPMVVVHILGAERFARSFSILRVCILPAPLLGAPFAGWLIDITGQYKAAFLVIGASAILSTVMALAIFVRMRYKNESNSKDEKSPDESDNKRHLTSEERDEKEDSL